MAKKIFDGEDFKRTLVELYHNGKIQASLIKEYGVSQTALSRWIKQYSTVETSNGEILTAKQIQELQKRNAQLEEENLILKKGVSQNELVDYLDYYNIRRIKAKLKGLPSAMRRQQALLAF